MGLVIVFCILRNIFHWDLFVSNDKTHSKYAKIRHLLGDCSSLYFLKYKRVLLQVIPNDNASSFESVKVHP